MGFAAIELAYNLWLRDSYVFDAYLRWNATASSWLLSQFWHATEAASREIHGPKAALSIQSGCDAIQPLALFVAAVAAYPVSFGRRLSALLIGPAAILGLNLLRIGTLYACVHYECEFFELLHVGIWPAVFVLFVAIVWIAWARWSLSRK